VVRGDVFELRAPRVARGREQLGRRYGVIVQSTRFLALSTVVVAPTSTAARPASFRPEVELEGERTRVMVEQLCALDYARLGGQVGSLSSEEGEEVDRALELLLDLGGRPGIP
jgi:mRNA interferase MazF